MRRVFLRDMVLQASIGVYAHEHTARQRIRVNVDLWVEETPHGDDVSRVVSYEHVAQAVRALVADGHVKLVETLADRIAEACLGDRRVGRVLVRVEKLDVFPDASSAGVEIDRTQTFN